MRGHRIVLLMLALLLIPTAGACAEIVVIVNAHNPVTRLTRNQLIDLYMGRQLNFPNGDPALPIDQAAGSGLRGRYYQALVGKSEAGINAYWARLLFSGIASPPRVMPTSESTLQIVRENVAAIAYVEATGAGKEIHDNRIKIVFSFDEKNTLDDR